MAELTDSRNERFQQEDDSLLRNKSKKAVTFDNQFYVEGQYENENSQPMQDDFQGQIQENESQQRNDYESLNFGSQNQQMASSKLKNRMVLNQTRESRTQQQMQKQVMDKVKAINSNLNRMPVDDIDLQFSQKHEQAMRDNVKGLFDLIKLTDPKTKEEYVDQTYLKAYLSNQNVSNLSPTFFKKVNDDCLENMFEGKLSEKEFMALFFNEKLLKRDITCQGFNDVDHKLYQPPDLVEIAELFEFLDEDRNGMISSKDLMSFLKDAELLKASNFVMQDYRKNKQNVPPSLENKFNLMKKELDDLVKNFDLTGDRMLSPEEFFNIIMYAYE